MYCGISRCKKLYSCHEYKEKKRCPKCDSLNTKKKGFIRSDFRTKRGIIKRTTQRFYCKDCNQSFTNNKFGNRIRFSEEIKHKAVHDYVNTKNSLSEVGLRYSITKRTILEWVNVYAKQSATILSVNKNITPSGIIQIDGKEIKSSNNKSVLLAASDSMSGRPLYYGVWDKENKNSSEHFLRGLRRIMGKTPIRGIISDFGKGKCFVGVVNRILPEAKHQVCIVHFLRYLNYFLPRTRRSEFYWRNKVLRKIIRNILTAGSKAESLYWLDKFISWIPFFRASYHKKFIRSIWVNYAYLTRHFEYDYLATNTNKQENLNRQLNRKLKNLDGFKSTKNIKPFLKIWFTNYIINVKHNDNKNIKNRPI